MSINMDKKEEKTPIAEQSSLRGKQNMDMEKLQKDLEDCKAKCEEYLNGWKRERADFINYKKEEMERISQMIKYANEELILKILPILDNIYLAESHVPESFGAALDKESEEAKWIEGFLQIKKQLSDFLQKEGIEPIEVLGKKFDPNLMEAVGEASNTQHLTPNTIVEEVQRGYTMHGKVIRPAKVKVAK